MKPIAPGHGVRRPEVEAPDAMSAHATQPTQSQAVTALAASSAVPPKADTRAAISTAVVVVLRKYTGRGPTRARTTISDDVIVVTLRDCLTTAENTLASHGHTSVVDAMRRALQNTMRDESIAVVEQLTARQVEACLSDDVQHPDLAVKIFLMHPTQQCRNARETRPRRGR